MEGGLPGSLRVGPARSPWPRPAVFQSLMSISPAADFIREEAWEDKQSGPSVNKSRGCWEGRGSEPRKD